MRRLYFRITLGVLIIIVLSAFVPRMVFDIFDRPDREGRLSPVPGAMMDMLRTRLEGLPPDKVQQAMDSLLPLPGISLSLIDADAGPPPFRPRDTVGPGRPFGRGHEHARPAAFIRLEASHKVLVISSDQNPGRPATWQLIFLISMILAITGIAGFLMIAPTVRGLQRLELATSRFGGGDFAARATVAEEDAVGSVARQFNVMADSIQGLFERERQLLQAVSHELRTPIARLRFSLDMLRSAATDEERRGRIHEIDDEIVEIDALVGELLDYNRLSSGSARLNRELLAVGPLLEDIAERLKDLRSDVTVRIIPADDDSCQVMADRPSFRRAIQNLLANALRHARSQVVIEYERCGDAVAVEISDDGAGIPMEERERVFEPFVRVDDSRSKESGGAGLGLAIVRRIMQLHGGSIAIDSADIGGAKFVTIWPDTPSTPSSA